MMGLIENVFREPMVPMRDENKMALLQNALEQLNLLTPVMA
jgi:dihydrodipicolinate synthase/N-acetylneuraminate lyase